MYGAREGVGVVLTPVDDREDARKRPRSGLRGGDNQAPTRRVTHHLRALGGGPSQLRPVVLGSRNRAAVGRRRAADSHDSAGGAA